MTSPGQSQVNDVILLSAKAGLVTLNEKSFEDSQMEWVAASSQYFEVFSWGRRAIVTL